MVTIFSLKLPQCTQENVFKRRLWTLEMGIKNLIPTKKLSQKSQVKKLNQGQTVSGYSCGS